MKTINFLLVCWDEEIYPQTLPGARIIKCEKMSDFFDYYKKVDFVLITISKKSTEGEKGEAGITLTRLNEILTNYKVKHEFIRLEEQSVELKIGNFLKSSNN